MDQLRMGDSSAHRAHMAGWSQAMRDRFLTMTATASRAGKTALHKLSDAAERVQSAVSSPGGAGAALSPAHAPSQRRRRGDGDELSEADECPDLAAVDTAPTAQAFAEVHVNDSYQLSAESSAAPAGSHSAPGDGQAPSAAAGTTGAGADAEASGRPADAAGDESDASERGLERDVPPPAQTGDAPTGDAPTGDAAANEGRP